MPGPDTQRVLRLERVAEEGKSHDMIDMGMRQEQIDIGDAVLRDRFAEVTQPRPGIENEQAGTAADLDTGGVTAIDGGVLARTGDRTAHAPEPDEKIAIG